MFFKLSYLSSNLGLTLDYLNPASNNPALKWTSYVLAACSKANRMLGFIRRSAFDIHDQRARKLLYLSLVRSNLAYCSQMWAPQAVNLILDFERIKRCATKFILPLPYRSELSKFPYWHDFLDLVPVLKCSVSLSDLLFQSLIPLDPWRTVSFKGTPVEYDSGQRRHL